MTLFILTSCSNLANDLQKRKNQNLYNIKIQASANGSVAASKTSAIKAGEEIILTVTAIDGYGLKSISVVNTLNKDVAVAAVEQGASYKFTMPNSDVTVGAEFEKAGPVDITNPEDLNSSNGNSTYTIYHYKQSLEDKGLYDLVATQSKRGNAGSETYAVAKSFQGFTARDFNQQTISSNGNTIIRIYYDRNIITYTFNLNGGNWDGSTDQKILSGAYGTNVNKKDPQKQGYSFVWNTTVPDYFGFENETFNAIWTANTDTPYTLEIYVQKIEGGNNYFLEESNQLFGTTDTMTHVHAAERIGFTFEIQQTNIEPDGSGVSKIYYNRKIFVISFDTCGGNPIEPQTVLYGQKFVLPEIPEKNGFFFWDWYLDQNYSTAYYYEGIHNSTTLYARWVDGRIQHRLHKNIEKMTPGADGTFGTNGEYVIFGDFPQSLKASEISIYSSVVVNIGQESAYCGSDGYLYIYKDEKYYKVEPIKWRILSKDENGEAILLAENVLAKSKYIEPDDSIIDYHDFNGFYSSTIIQYLNETFAYFAFSEEAWRQIKLNTDWYVNIYILGINDVNNTDLFPYEDTLKRSGTDYAGGMSYWWLSTWKPPSLGLSSTNFGQANVVRFPSISGRLNTSGMPCTNTYGLVPAITVHLPEED